MSAPAAADPYDPPGSRRDRLGLWSLALANGISQTGNSMTSLAVPWFVLATTGSASRTGIAGAVVALSPVIAGLIAGPVVDRLGFRAASIISDALSGVTVALIPTLYLLDWLSYWQLLVLIFLGAFFDVPGSAARGALIPTLARRAGAPLERANSVMQLSNRLSDTVIAPLLAGVLISALGAVEVLYIDAGTFGVSIVIVALLIAGQPARVPAPEEDAGAAESFIDNVLAGFRFVVRDPVLQTMLPAAILFNFVGTAYGAVLLPVYVRAEYDSAAYFGVLVTALGIGMLAGIVLFGVIGPRVRRYAIFLGGFGLAIAAVWLFALTSYLPTDLIALFCMGLGVGPLTPLLQTLVQLRAPELLLGRVISAIFTLFTVATPLGALAGGLAIDAFGLRAALLLSAALMSIVPLWLALSPRARAAAPAFDD